MFLNEKERDWAFHNWIKNKQKKYKMHSEKNPDLMHNPDLQNKKASICYAGMIKHRFLIIGIQTLYFRVSECFISNVPTYIVLPADKSLTS